MPRALYGYFVFMFPNKKPVKIQPTYPVQASILTGFIYLFSSASDQINESFGFIFFALQFRF